MTGLIIDNFAGGGGASTGLEAAFGRPVDVAVNHDEAAIAVHAANHPHTRHLCQSIMAIDPLDATEGKPVVLVWFSPDCKHHSKAKGGKPRDKNIRDLAQVVPHWLERLRKATPGGRGAPRVIMLENVEEFRQWGPLDAEGMPIKERRGEEFKLWVARIRRQGYKVEWRELRACDYGAPTSRKRLFLIARADGMPIVWPEPTHGKPGSAEVLAGKRLPWRTAAECIDWTISCPSIFERKRPLKDATCRRIAAGVMRYVVNSARPFIVPITHTGPVRVHSIDDPLRTITTAKRGELAVASPVFARTAHGDVDSRGRRRGRGEHGVEEPFPTVTASRDSALVTAHLTHFYSSNTRGGEGDPTKPMKTVTAGGKHHAVAAATLIGVGGRRGQSPPLAVDRPAPTQTVKADAAIVAATLVQSGYGERQAQAPRALDIEAPLGTVVAGGAKHAPVAAFLSPFYGEGTGGKVRGHRPDDPLPVVTCDPRHSAVAAFLHKFASGNAPAGAEQPLQTIEQREKHSIVAAHLAQHNTERGERVNAGKPADDPISTITGRGTQQQVVETTLIEADALPPEMMERAVRTAAFLVKYYGNESDAHSVEAPIGTVTTRERFAVVTVTIDAVTFVLVDIGMRMLEPRELANAQGFPPDYILAPVCWYVTDSGARKYGPLPKSHQIAKIGNSVCPVMAEALARANCTGAAIERIAA